MAGEFGVAVAFVVFAVTLILGAVQTTVSVILVTLVASVLALLCQFSVYFLRELLVPVAR